MSDTKAIKKSNTSDVMTVERLRDHLFGGPQVPFWNYDPAQITIGMEIEYFIAHVHGQSFTLATKAEYLEVMEHLKRDAKYKDLKLYDQPGRISRDTELGFIAIKPDFAWHILEISLPPRKKIEELRSLLEMVFGEVDRALAKVGLERLDISCLPDVPEKMDLVELDRLNSHISILENQSSKDPYCLPIFPAVIVATHVHLNAFDADSLDLMPFLYELEPAMLQTFSRALGLNSNPVNNCRTLFYERTLGDKYKLRTIPQKIPSSLSELVNALNESPKLFPNSKFFPVRDMSYIRPSQYGTIEFRSSCSYRSIDTLISIARSRIVQLIIATNLKMSNSSMADLTIEFTSWLGSDGNRPSSVIDVVHEILRKRRIR